MISQKLRNAIKLSTEKEYKIAQKAGLHPSTFSKIVCGIDQANPGDPRVIAIGKVFGMNPDECFEFNKMEISQPTLHGGDHEQ